MRVLAVGAHPDDIELGCGGALGAHRARGDEISLLVMTTGEYGPQEGRSRVFEQEDAARLLSAQLYWGCFEDGGVPEGRASVAVVERVLAQVQADVIYTHTTSDTHQDHRHTGEATLAAARRASRVLCYESPTSLDFRPVVYMDVSAHMEMKLATCRAHLSQVLKNGLVDLEAVEAQARWRGFQARLPHGSAEAFEAPRFLWDLSPATSSPVSTAVGAHDLQITSPVDEHLGSEVAR
ncbi:MAG: PIG-L family deacetylase [Actinobacteria bacterium]|nr:PIG-L family deacetylase [Actinomycetota bacterium]